MVFEHKKNLNIKQKFYKLNNTLYTTGHKTTKK